jgi:hypothetical protein
MIHEGGTKVSLEQAALWLSDRQGRIVEVDLWELAPGVGISADWCGVLRHWQPTRPQDEADRYEAFAEYEVESPMGQCVIGLTEVQAGEFHVGEHEQCVFSDAYDYLEFAIGEQVGLTVMCPPSNRRYRRMAERWDEREDDDDA